jgi:hypothetical protein
VNLFRLESANPELVSSVQGRMDAIPLNIGPWKGTAKPSDAKVMKVAEALAHSSRVYVHETTQEAVSVLLLFGETSAQGAHDPEFCYAGYGYRRVSNREQHSLPAERTGAAMELWTARFERPDPSQATLLQVYWGWGRNGEWTAPNRPRFALASEKMIYKIYIQRPLSEASLAAKNPNLDEFLVPYLAEVRRSLQVAN